jgi:hypothetical protein
MGHFDRLRTRGFLVRFRIRVSSAVEFVREQLGAPEGLDEELKARDRSGSTRAKDNADT